LTPVGVGTLLLTGGVDAATLLLCGCIDTPAIAVVAGAAVAGDPAGTDDTAVNDTGATDADVDAPSGAGGDGDEPQDSTGGVGGAGEGTQLAALACVSHRHTENAQLGELAMSKQLPGVNTACNSHDGYMKVPPSVGTTPERASPYNNNVLRFVKPLIEAGSVPDSPGFCDISK
jgi:hypothetical protein